MKKILLSAALSLSAHAAAAEINIYSTREPALIEPVIDAFTKATGIEASIAFVREGLVERLKVEGKRSPADLVMTTDIANLQQIVEADVLQVVKSATLDTAVPVELRSPDGLWFALTRRARIVFASKERVAPGEITSYEDLASDRWRGRICSRSGAHNYNLALVAAAIVHHGEEAAARWAEALRSNLARKPQGNDRAQVKAIWAGECDISLGNTYYMGQMLADDEQRQWADSVSITFPSFEGGGTHMNVSGIALTRAAPNRDEAILFMEYLVSPEAQRIYAAINHEYPVVAGVDASELVESWGEFRADELDLGALAAERGRALRIMQSVQFDD